MYSTPRSACVYYIWRYSSTAAPFCRQAKLYQQGHWFCAEILIQSIMHCLHPSRNVLTHMTWQQGWLLQYSYIKWTHQHVHVDLILCLATTGGGAGASINQCFCPSRPKNALPSKCKERIACLQIYFGTYVHILGVCATSASCRAAHCTCMGFGTQHLRVGLNNITCNKAEGAACILWFSFPCLICPYL